MGARVHAIVQPVDPADAPRPSDIIDFAKARLAAYKVPKTVELVEAIRGTSHEVQTVLP